VGSRSFIDAGSAQFTFSSSRTIKENLSPVQVPNILDKISQVGVYNYDYINGPKDKLGLMAEDFHTVFGRGSDKLINGQEVEMALWLAVQQLTAQNKELAAQNNELIQRLERLEARLSEPEVQK
jgi:DNA anti-recombination protein RmuC